MVAIGVRRLVAAIVMLTGIWVLALFVDAAFMPVFDAVMGHDGFADSPWAGPIEHLPAIAYLVVAILIVGVFGWLLLSPIRRTPVEIRRREIERRRRRR